MAGIFISGNSLELVDSFLNMNDDAIVEYYTEDNKPNWEVIPKSKAYDYFTEDEILSMEDIIFTYKHQKLFRLMLDEYIFKCKSELMDKILGNEG